jgi:hypothetical protein
MAAVPLPLTASLIDRIEITLNETPERPWCIHRLYEELVQADRPGERDDGLLETQVAADELVRAGRAAGEKVSAVSIGVHCQDSLYWSTLAGKERLEQFGPEYESPTILRRLASHMYCHGL